MPRPVERVHPWASQVRAEVLQEAGHGQDRVLHLHLQRAELRRKLIGDLDRPVHLSNMFWTAYVPQVMAQGSRTKALPAHVRYVTESFRHHLECFRVVVHEDEVAFQFVGGHSGRAAAREEVQHEVARVR